jgi:sterol desaturase/sphingolipid hydroxylase (fatty acid hydroxylase superfamily)
MSPLLHPLDALLALLARLPLAHAVPLVIALNAGVFAAALTAGWAAGRLFAHRRVSPPPPPIGATELWLALVCVLLNGAVAAAGLVLWRAGWIVLRPDEPLRVARDLLVLFVAMDLGMYVTHRLAHHRLLFKVVHATHHRYDRPRPLTLFVLNPFEVLGFGALWLAVLSVYPSSPLGMMLFLVLNVIFGVLGHLGVEPLPAAWLRLPLSRVLTTSTFHAVHHRDAEHNFGFYTLVWDRLLSTVSPDYVGAFASAGRPGLDKDEAGGAPR